MQVRRASTIEGALMKRISSTLLLLVISACCLAASPPVKAKRPILVYRNPKYAITFTLPQQWQGFTVVHEKWEALLQSSDFEKTLRTEHGLIITLRNPRWTKKHPTQDIPILIFTRQQWKWEHAGRLFPYAGGILYELGHNQKYVLAIYSRFNFNEANKGWQEAGTIAGNNLDKNKHPLYQE
jgi:hypothetical protein